MKRGAFDGSLNLGIAAGLAMARESTAIMGAGVVMVVFSVVFWVSPVFPGQDTSLASELGIILGLFLFGAGYAARRLKDRYNL
jgi:acyl dehydratase